MVQNITSKKTNVNQLPSVVTLVDRYFGWQKGTVNVDIGSGKHNKVTKFLAKKGVKNLCYDPYNRLDEVNRNTLSRLSEERADTAVLANVLNVVGEEQQYEILKLAKGLVKRNGRIYISVYEGDKSGVGKMSRPDCWQENKRTEFYIDRILKVFAQVSRKGKLVIAK